MQPACGGGAISPGEDDRGRRQARHRDFEGELDVAGKVLEGVEGGPEAEIDGEFEAPGLAGDEAVAADAMFAGVDTGDVRGVTEGQGVHVDAGPGGGEKGKPEFQIQLDVQREPSVPALGGAVLGGSDAAHEVAGLGDQEAAVVEAADERVQVLVGHFGRRIEHRLDRVGPGANFVWWEREEETACVDVPAQDCLHFRGGRFRQELRDRENIISFDRVGRIWGPTEELQDEREDLAAAL
jgi:hypothetical protein